MCTKNRLAGGELKRIAGNGFRLFAKIRYLFGITIIYTSAEKNVVKL